MSEKSDYATLKRNLSNGYDRLERVENVCGSGNPDINFCSEGVECWIEMKSPKEPVRKTSKLFGDNHPLLQTQKNWFLRQKNAKGRAYILIATDKRWMLIDGCRYGDEVNNMTVTQLTKRAYWWAMKPLKKEQWEDLRSTLNA